MLTGTNRIMYFAEGRKIIAVALHEFVKMQSEVQLFDLTSIMYHKHMIWG